MAHLISEIRNTSVSDCRRRVGVCHDYLVEAGKLAVCTMSTPQAVSTWGTTVKRIAAVFISEMPSDIGEDIKSHNLVEIINQTATVERLLDVLDWVQTPGSGLAEFNRVVVCHPSTSGAHDKNVCENDLVLCAPVGATARFEVSDVVSSNDGNGKFRKDLKTLLLTTQPLGVPSRLFLGVSEEFADSVKRRRLPSEELPLTMVEVKAQGKTHIFEAVPTLAAAVSSGTT